MAVQTIKLAGRRFVILPESEYRALQGRKAPKRRPPSTRRPTPQDLGDIAEAKRRRREPTVPLADVVKRLTI